MSRKPTGESTTAHHVSLAVVLQVRAGTLQALLWERARPPFAAEGPFVGWKASGYGTPEHGRWNRDFYTRAQAIYGD